MGLLKTVVGGGQQKAGVTVFKRTRDSAGLAVAGAHYHQDDIGQLAGRSFLGRIQHENQVALVMPDSRNAIAVHLLHGGHPVLVGYLASDDAKAYRPVFRYIAPNSIRCAAVLARDDYGKRPIVVYLNLGTPGELIAELWTEEHPLRTDHQWAGKLVVFTGSSRLRLEGVLLDREGQQMLAQVAGCQTQPRVTKTINVCVACSAKDDTGNLEKAQRYGLEIVTEADFWHEIGLQVESAARRPGPRDRE